VSQRGQRAHAAIDAAARLKRPQHKRFLLVMSYQGIPVHVVISRSIGNRAANTSAR
jgi:hypothetical protein